MNQKLSPYRAKRDFSKTAEPSGRKGVKPTSALRFVIQKHDARRLHYDLRLELDGIFKSWAVTRGPSLDPADKRLAVEVEDHPLDYGDFEGTIPEGQYGGGTVLLWDRGTWAPESMTAQEGLAQGDLKFTLSGEKLSGSWVLVRMKHDRAGGKRTNWLLIKHKDEQAVSRKGDAILTEDKSVASGRNLEEISQGLPPGPSPFMTKGHKPAKSDAVWAARDAEEDESLPPTEDRAREPATSKPGKKSARPRAAKPKRAVLDRPVFIEPQLCTSVDTPPSGSNWAHEVKFDGYRVQMSVQGGEVCLRTRKGLDWTAKFPAIAKAAAALPDCIVDGEITALDEHGSPDFSALQAAIADGRTDQLVFFAFDLLWQADRDLRGETLKRRKEALQALLGGHAPDHPLLRYVEHFTSGGDAVLQAACRMSLEGIVSKRLDAPYRSGRSDDWVKAKCRGGQEVVIGGWADTNGKFRSLLAGLHRDGRLLYVGRVGTGFGADKVARILPVLQAHQAARSPFSGPGAPHKAKGIHWLDADLVAEIHHGGWTEAGMVRQAAFKSLRDDKPAEEVEAQDPAPATTTDLAKPVRIAGRKAPTDVMGVSLTHADKVLWPDDGHGRPVTKRDLAAYFEAVSAWMMPHLEGRPCSLVRTPDGIDGQHFMQRHAMPGTSALIDVIKLEDEPRPFLQIDRPEGLVAAAQNGATEIHPWNGLPGKPNIPGRLVFDLDPGPDVSFEAVIEAAREIKDRLEEIGLASFPKTTGGKGLHVVVPLRADKNPPSWDDTKAFARAVCTAMAQDNPEAYVVTMSKKDRVGRIYLDYLRNDRSATAVAVLSPRARPGAPVSMPLTWRELRKGLRPDRYTIRTVPGLLAGSKTWADYAASACSLTQAIRRFNQTVTA